MIGTWHRLPYFASDDGYFGFLDLVVTLALYGAVVIGVLVVVVVLLSAVAGDEEEGQRGRLRRWMDTL